MGSLRVIEVSDYEIKGFRGKAIDGVRISAAAHGHAEFSQYEFNGPAGFDIGNLSRSALKFILYALRDLHWGLRPTRNAGSYRVDGSNRRSAAGTGRRGVGLGLFANLRQHGRLFVVGQQRSDFPQRKFRLLQQLDFSSQSLMLGALLPQDLLNVFDAYPLVAILEASRRGSIGIGLKDGYCSNHLVNDGRLDIISTPLFHRIKRLAQWKK